MTWILIALLVGLFAVFLWSLDLRRLQKRYHLRKIRRRRFDPEQDLVVAPAGDPDAADHNPVFQGGHLRDAIHGMEVSELTLDDQIAHDHAIRLLHRMVARSPADASNRYRLLSLLHKTQNKDDFIREAREFKKWCQPTAEQTWDWICEMGKDLAPESLLFNSGNGEAREHMPFEDDRRVLERRGRDRRVNVTNWLGNEQRKGSRRWHFRREADQARRS